MRVRGEHWQLLLSFCESHPQLITNRFSGSDGRAKANLLWQSVTSKLNSLGFGEKNVDGWRKTLTDWKSKTKAKAAALRRDQNKTGGGPPELPPLSTLEEKLLELMGTKALEGDRMVPELGFGKTLTDWKSKTKAKAAALRRDQNKTGGGPPELPPLSTLEEKLLELMGTKALEGDRMVPELGFGKIEIPQTNNDENKRENIAVEVAGSISDTPTFGDHIYSEKPLSPLCSTTIRKLEYTEHPRKRILRSKNYTTNTPQTKQLVDISQTSIELLKKINDNTERMAISLEIIAKCAQNLVNDRK
ncbi:hypothetical protein FQR65_LT07737 [Abscondita terminalis]|nr:hypothetical protein FQR65_LT07737 [Abscondita terminalis]